MMEKWLLNETTVETVVYLSKLKSDEHVKVEVDMSEFEPTLMKNC